MIIFGDAAINQILEEIKIEFKTCDVDGSVARSEYSKMIAKDQNK
jgi:hypothetical protein